MSVREVLQAESDLTNFPLLSEWTSPVKLQSMTLADLKCLAAEIRKYLCQLSDRRSVHFASNLGVVELAIALHSVFDFQKDRIIWDTGHQCYPHKILTGRFPQMDSIRTLGGLTGFPNPAESSYDLMMTGHAGCSIGTALGLTVGDELFDKMTSFFSNKEEQTVGFSDSLDSENDGTQTVSNDNARKRSKRKQKYKNNSNLYREQKRYSIAVIGDGALASGVVFEALNNAGGLRKNMTVILNDNKMSICPRVGGLARYLDELRMSPAYLGFKRNVHRFVDCLTLGKGVLGRSLARFKNAVKAGFLGGMLFEEFGFRYIGPIDGHNIAQLQKYLRLVRYFDEPVLLHVFTEKGKGFQPAEKNPENFHSSHPSLKKTNLLSTPIQNFNLNEKKTIQTEIQSDLNDNQRLDNHQSDNQESKKQTLDNQQFEIQRSDNQRSDNLLQKNQKGEQTGNFSKDQDLTFPCSDSDENTSGSFSFSPISPLSNEDWENLEKSKTAPPPKKPGLRYRPFMKTTEESDRLDSVRTLVGKRKRQNLSENCAELLLKLPTDDLWEHSSEHSFTHWARNSLLKMMLQDARVCVITAAMTQGNMLEPIRKYFPDRFFDVGICEAHAVNFAAGLAKSGMRPVVDVYSTFMQRAYDHIFQEMSLQDLPVLLMLDRAGLAGADGPTHHGVFDLAYLRHFPNLVVLAPADSFDMENMVRFALSQNHPAAIRYPKAQTPFFPRPNGMIPLTEVGKAEFLRKAVFSKIFVTGIKGAKTTEIETTEIETTEIETTEIETTEIETTEIETADINISDIEPKTRELNSALQKNVQLSETHLSNIHLSKKGTFIVLGGLAEEVLKASERLALEYGIEMDVLNARFVKPLDKELLLRPFRTGEPVFSVEEGILSGGFGSAILEVASDENLDVRNLTRCGIPDRFVQHGTRKELFKELGLDADGLVQTVLKRMNRQNDGLNC